MRSYLKPNPFWDIKCVENRKKKNIDIVDSHNFALMESEICYNSKF